MDGANAAPVRESKSFDRAPWRARAKKLPQSRSPWKARCTNRKDRPRKSDRGSARRREIRSGQAERLPRERFYSDVKESNDHAAEGSCDRRKDPRSIQHLLHSSDKTAP